ncbi:LysR substrate-binding domain-containing protein [Mesorhizobium sp. SB112]|uniref:LysR family transcriptional regulator n=1 Tax=Mesorhizobium sp. SB112 TaxID=3151853 RepID=UPI003263FD6A
MKKNFTKVARGLDSVSAFLRVADRRSFRAAAIDWGVSPSAVSQSIMTLEARVGVALVSRSTRSVGLTEAGQRFIEHAKPAMENLDAAFEAARSLGERPSGLLRITVPRSVVTPVLEPALPEFCAAYPDIDIEIVADSGFVDIVAAGFDAGIRLGELVDADMIGVRLTPPFRYCVVGSPSYFQKHGHPVQPADLGSHRAIRYRQERSGGVYRWEFVENGREVEINVSGPLTLNDETLLPSMAMKGLGLAYLAEPLVHEEVVRGRLETVLDTYCPQSPGLFLYYPSRAQRLPKLKVFIDHMIKQRKYFEERMSL